MQQHLGRSPGTRLSTCIMLYNSNASDYKQYIFGLISNQTKDSIVTISLVLRPLPPVVLHCCKQSETSDISYS